MRVKHHITASVYDKRGRLLAVGRNSYAKTHPAQKLFARYTQKPNRAYLHAELDGLLKASKRGQPYSIHVERRSKAGRLLLAKPCDCCMKIINHYGVEEITWSTAHD